MKRFIYALPLFIQLLVGGTLFLISFWIEVQAFTHLFDKPWAALFLALALEVGKAVAIFHHRYLDISAGMLPYPASVRIVSYSFRLGLICLSFLATLMILSYTLFNVQKQIEEQKHILIAQNTQLWGSYQASHAKERESFLKQQERDYLLLKQEVDSFKQKRTAEMDNRVNGQFKGPRYKEFNALYEDTFKRLEALQTRQQRDLQRFTEQHSNAYQVKEKELNAQLNQALKQLALEPDTARKDAHNPMLVSLITLLQKLLPDYAPSMAGFILFLALFIALLMELGIVLAFENIALALSPQIQQHVQYQIEKDTLQTQFEHEKETDAMQHENDLEFMRRKSKQTYEKGTAYFDDAA